MTDSREDRESPFATAVDHIEQAFHFVISPIELTSETRDRLKGQYIEAHRSGSPKAEIVALQSLDRMAWRWPAFDHWHNEFEQVKAWPYMWKKAAENHHDQYGNEAYRAGKTIILQHYLAKSCFRVRDWHKKKPYFQKWGWRPGSSLGCAVEDAVAWAREPEIRLDDWRTWPPFFPGDRNSMVGQKPLKGASW